MSEKELNFIAFYVFVSSSWQCMKIWDLRAAGKGGGGGGGGRVLDVHLLIKILTFPQIINQKQKLKSQKNN